MNRYERLRFWVILVAVIVIAGAAAILLGACGKGAPLQPVACATYQAPDGTWMEEDNEPVDDDPCDLDDLWEREHKTPTPKPRVKSTVVKPSPARTQPIGGRSKKF